MTEPATAFDTIDADPAGPEDPAGYDWSAVTGRIAGATLESVPFEWSVIDGLFDPELAATLAASFPSAGYRLSSTQPDYTFLYRGLINEGTLINAGSLSAAWREFGKVLAGDAYRAAMQQLTGRDLDGLKVYGGFCRYEPGCSLRPHPDRPIRVLTQTIYFSPHWNEQWGGSLLILRSADPGQVHRRVTPVLGRSVVFVRSDHSWHAVERVRRGIDAVRRSLLLHYSR